MSSEQSLLFVVALGVSVVFVGLILIILLCKIMSAFCRIGENKTKAPIEASQPQVNTAAAEVIQNRQEIIAAVSAAVAEELGTDISAIRILSFKKI